MRKKKRLTWSLFFVVIALVVVGYAFSDYKVIEQEPKHILCDVFPYLYEQGSISSEISLQPVLDNVLYLPFDDSIGDGLTPDESGLGNDAGCSGSNCPVSTSGSFNDAYDFDGNNDYLLVSDDPSLQLGDMTIMAWVYIPGSIPSGWRAILEHGRGTDQWYGLWKANGGNKFHFRWHNGGGVGSRMDFDSVIEPNQWYHVVGVLEGDTASVYLNGALDNSRSNVERPGNADSGDLFVGAVSGETEHFKGKIDEVAVFDRALSSSEILDIYNSGIGGSGGTRSGSGGGGDTAGGSTEGFDDALLAYLPFDDPISDGSTPDVTGNGNQGTCSSGNCPVSSSGQIGNGYDFNGGEKRIEIGTMDIPGNEMTISVWARWDGGGAIDSRIVSKANGAEKGDHWWTLGTDDLGSGRILRFRLKSEDTACNGNNFGTTRLADGSDTDEVSAFDSLVSGEWFHAVATYDANDQGNMKIYKDGKLIAARPHSCGGNLNQDSSVLSFIGDAPIDGDSDGSWDGVIDEVRIYDRALSAQEILDQYNTEKDGVIPVCGNGLVESGEQCESNSQCGNGEHCSECQCVSGGCGNGVLDSGEECDGNDFGSSSCQSEGFEAGTLSCSNNCEIETNTCSDLACVLTSAEWDVSSLEVGQGTLVTLRVIGNNCAGDEISFDINEDDMFAGDDFTDDDVVTEPNNAIFGSNGVATTTWISEYQCDGPNPFVTCPFDPPEYYFIATLVSSGSSIQSPSDEELRVSAATGGIEVDVNIDENDLIRDTTPLVEFNSNNAVSLSYRTNGGTNEVSVCTGCTFGSAFLDLPEGDHSITVFGRNDGNVASKTVNFRIDLDGHYFDDFSDGSQFESLNGVEFVNGKVGFTGSADPGTPIGFRVEAEDLILGDKYIASSDCACGSPSEGECVYHQGPRGEEGTATISSFAEQSGEYTVSVRYCDEEDDEIEAEINDFRIILNGQEVHSWVTVVNQQREWKDEVIVLDISSGDEIVFGGTTPNNLGTHARIDYIEFSALSFSSNGDFVSKPIITEELITEIEKVTWSETGTDDSNVVGVDISVDGGVTYESVLNGEGISSVNGNNLVYRVNFATEGENTIEIESLNITWFDAGVCPGVNEICDGLDNDCDGLVDEGMDGNPLTQACYSGGVNTQDVGICAAGTQVCENGVFGICSGEVTPVAEICESNHYDEDCDGVGNEGCACSSNSDCDDGVFCNGIESCDDGGLCIAPNTTDVCPGTNLFCYEEGRKCEGFAVEIETPDDGDIIRVDDSPIDVTVEFDVRHFDIGGKDDNYVVFQIDGEDDFDYDDDELRFYNGDDDIIELNSEVGETDFAEWIDSDSFEFKDLEIGSYKLRAFLVNGSSGERMDNSDATDVISFRIDFDNRGGGSTGGGGDDFWIRTVFITESQLRLGFMDNFGIRERGVFVLEGVDSHVGVKDVTGDSVLVSIGGLGEDRINEGQTKRYDLNRDGRSDLDVSVQSVSGPRAILLIKSTSPDIVDFEEEETIEEDGLPLIGIILLWLIILLLLLILILLIWYYSRDRRKKVAKSVAPKPARKKASGFISFGGKSLAQRKRQIIIFLKKQFGADKEVYIGK